MVKLTNQEIEDRLNLEGGIVSEPEIDSNAEPETNTEMQDAVFYFNEDLIQIKTVQDRETLEQGTSYNEHMLDLNELAEKGLIGRGTKIDLSDMPEIDTLQAATEEQLLMIMPENRKQITAIHLSNNTPVGWDYGYDYHNTQKLDETMDLTSFSGLEKFETHFYLNDDLKTVKLPDSVTAVKFQHSKMENLDMPLQVEMNQAETLKNLNIRQFRAAVVDGDLDSVKEYVKSGIDVNYHDEDTCPTLLLALNRMETGRDSYAQIAKHLIKSGANVNESFGIYSPLNEIAEKTLIDKDKDSDASLVNLAEDLLKAGARFSLDGLEYSCSSPKLRDLFLKYQKQYDTRFGSLGDDVLALDYSNCHETITDMAKHGVKFNEEHINLLIDRYNERGQFDLFDNKIYIREYGGFSEVENGKLDWMQENSRNNMAFATQKSRILALVKSGNEEIIKQIVGYAKSTGNQQVLDDVEAIINKDKQRQLTESKIRVNKQKYRLDSKQGKTEAVEAPNCLRRHSRAEMSDEVKQKLASDKQNG